MALQDILAAITQEADQRIADARTEHQRALTRMREESERRIARKKQEVAAQKQQKMEVLRRKTEVHAATHKRNTALSKKKELLDRVYTEAAKAFAMLPEKELEPILRSCVKSIKDKGQIFPAAQHAAFLKKICPSEQFTIESPIEASGGFLFVSDTKEQDYTFESLIKDRLRPKTELSISRTLFA